MLVIRMQRTGRKGHAMFRVVVQDSRRTPTSGKIVAQLGSYDPHTKTTVLNKEKAQFYLDHGAQPSDRAIRLLQAESVKLPDWVIVPAGKERTVRNPEKRRSTKPAEEEPETPAEPAAETETTEAVEAEAAPDAVPAEAVAVESASDEASAEAADEAEKAA